MQTPTAATSVSLDELLEMSGAELGAAEWQAVEQERIDGFAAATLDQQWIHVDPERAAAGPFGTTIAHGFLTLSLCSHFLEQIIEVVDASMTVNYGLEKVRFPSPVTVGSEIRGVGRLAAVEERSGCVQAAIDVTVERRGAAAGKPVCAAKMVLRFYR
ncbi:MAG: MaoC family dehydratase [Solirubrobacterales bacterium]